VIKNIDEISSNTSISLIAFVKGVTLTFYDDTKRAKYQTKFSQIKFGKLAKHLRGLSFKRIQGMFVHSDGVLYD
jgi:hypothetical protein